MPKPAPTATPATDTTAALIADLDAGLPAKEAGAAPAKKPGKAAPAPTDDDDADEGDGVEATPDEGDDDEPADDAAGEGADEPDDAPADGKDDEPDDDEPADDDPATLRKLALVQKAEKRAKAEIAREKADFLRLVGEQQAKYEALEREWAPRVAAAEKYEAAVKRARRDPVGLFTAAGLKTDEMLEAARLVYVYCKGESDPKTRDAAQRMQREREQTDDTATLRKELDELKAEQAAEKAAVGTAQRREKFTDALVTAAKTLATEAKDKTAEDAAPVVNKLLAKNPAKTREKLFAIADEIGRRTGEVPDADEVIAELEKRERADLDDRGVDLAAYLGAPAAPAKKPSKTLGRAGGGGKGNPAPKSDGDLLSEVARELDAGKHLDG